MAGQKITNSQPARRIDMDTGQRIAAAHGLAGVYFRYPGAACMAANDLLVNRKATFADQEGALVRFLREQDKKTNSRLQHIKSFGNKAGYYNLEAETIGHKAASMRRSSRGK